MTANLNAALSAADDLLDGDDTARPSIYTVMGALEELRDAVRDMPQPESNPAREARLARREAELAERAGRLARREERLARRESEQDDREAAQARREERLARREDRQNARDDS